VHASYTYLETRNDVSGARLVRRPRHVGDIDAHVPATKAWLVGAGLHLVADRVDSGGPLGGWTTARLYTSYAINPGLRLKLRVENALNRTYEEVYGYAALPRGVFGGVEWRF
jgi:vitamin B12 transporter